MQFDLKYKVRSSLTSLIALRPSKKETGFRCYWVRLISVALRNREESRLDTKKKQYVEKEEFVERVVELEMLPKKKAARIFKEFLTDQAIPKLTLEQIDPVAADCLKRGDLKMITAKRGGSPPASPPQPSSHRIRYWKSTGEPMQISVVEVNH